jgi:MFS family permease
VKSLAALRVRAFAHLAAAYTINELGNWIGDVALAILVFDRTRSPVATATLFVALRFAPALLAPPLTTKAEKIPPRQVLPALYLGEAVIFGAISVLAHSFSLPAVLTLAAADGILAVVARALIRSVNASILGPRRLLREGNAVINLGVTAGGAAGPALAGVLVATAGAGSALAVDAATFAAVAVIVASTRDLEMDIDLRGGTLERLRAGLSDAWARRTVRRLLLATAGTLLFGAAVIPIEVVFAKRTLHAGDFGYGLLMTAWGVGMVIGGTAFAATSKIRLPVVIFGAAALVGAGYAGLAASPDLFVACVFSGIGGLGNGLWSIASLTALQQAMPPRAQGTVMAVLESINQVMPAIGFVLGGAVTALGSTRLAYAVASAGVAVVLVAQLLHPIEAVDDQTSSADAT